MTGSGGWSKAAHLSGARAGGRCTGVGRRSHLCKNRVLPRPSAELESWLRPENRGQGGDVEKATPFALESEPGGLTAGGAQGRRSVRAGTFYNQRAGPGSVTGGLEREGS